MTHLPISRTFCQLPLAVSSCTLNTPGPIAGQSMSLRRFTFLTIAIVLHPGLARAQSPVAAAAAPNVSASFGYSAMSLGLAPSSRVVLNGLDASASSDFLSRIGLKLDVGYARAWNALGSGRHSDVLSYLGGPVVRLSRQRRFAAYAQGLLGGARVTGPVPVTGGGFASGYVNKLAWSAGLSTEYRFSDAFAFRVGADYLQTAYFTSSAAFRGQSDFRTTGSIVYYFGRGSRVSSH